MNDVRGPSSQQRTIILGRTGTGKSQFAIAILAQANWDEMPWIIIDYKGEDLILDIMAATKGRIQTLKPTDAAPKKAGLYYMHPTPKIDDEAMEAFLWKVWKQGHIGLFIDEGYVLPQRDAFDTILTQGRTLYIPVICLYQRPAWMSRFAVAQSDFRAAFALDDDRDCKTAAQFFKPVTTEKGEKITVFNDLPPYFCLWYDVSRGLSTVLRPAPTREAIISSFVKRLRPIKTRALI